MKTFYYIAGFPHIISFIIYRNIIPEIKEDLKHYTQGNANIKNFVSLLAKKEYRTVFYYRLPFWLRHILNLILRRERSCYIHTSNIGGGLYV